MRDGRPVDETRLDALARAMAHRGPDGVGAFVSGPIGLLNTRLAIIDLATGDQPLFEPQGAVLVANAEIYNDLDLRRSLTAAFTEMAQAFPAPLGSVAAPVFGPSGLLRQRIEHGELADILASADMAQPRALAREQAGRLVVMFTRNRLCALTWISQT